MPKILFVGIVKRNGTSTFRARFVNREDIYGEHQQREQAIELAIKFGREKCFLQEEEVIILDTTPQKI